MAAEHLQPVVLSPRVPSHDLARELFDRTAEHYQRRSEHRVTSFSTWIFQRRIEIVTQFLARLRTPGRVLDFGMGPGVFAPRCTDRGLDYVGIDISSVMVGRAQALGLQRAQYRVGDLETLAEFAGQMDVVLAIGLVDYLEAPWEGLAALSAAVKPGGVLIVSFRNRWSLPRALRDAGRAILTPWRSADSRRAFLGLVHERSFDGPSELEPALRRLGHEHFETAYFNCSPFFSDFPMPAWMFEGWRRVDAVLASRVTRVLCSGGVMVAAKPMPRL